MGVGCLHRLGRSRPHPVATAAVSLSAGRPLGAGADGSGARSPYLAPDNDPPWPPRRRGRHGRLHDEVGPRRAALHSLPISQRTFLATRPLLLPPPFLHAALWARYLRTEISERPCGCPRRGSHIRLGKRLAEPADGAPAGVFCVQLS